MSDPVDLHLHAKAAQARAERGGVPRTAAALAAIPGTIALDVGAGPRPAARGAGPATPVALPIVREAPGR